MYVIIFCAADQAGFSNAIQALRRDVSISKISLLKSFFQQQQDEEISLGCSVEETQEPMCHQPSAPLQHRVSIRLPNLTATFFTYPFVKADVRFVILSFFS